MESLFVFFIYLVKVFGTSKTFDNNGDDINKKWCLVIISIDNDNWC